MVRFANQLILDLKQHKSNLLFNPYSQFDLDFDNGEDAPVKRATQLRHYLQCREDARYILVAEAMGYQGGKFTGIAMTSERIIAGHHPNVARQHVLLNGLGQRTSNPGMPEHGRVFDITRNQGFAEPTATVVWTAMQDIKVDPFSVILWNALPFHPYKSDKGALSNRTPTKSELKLGLVFLQRLLEHFPKVQVIAIGNRAQCSLGMIDASFQCIRHPANSGATGFRAGLSRVICH